MLASKSAAPLLRLARLAPRPRTGAIAGGVVGGFLAAALAVVVCQRWRHRTSKDLRRRRESYAELVNSQLDAPLIFGQHSDETSGVVYAARASKSLKASGSQGSLCRDLGTAFISTSEQATTFSAGALVEATKDFDSASQIAEGSYGTIYRGTLPKPDGREAAIKVLKLERMQKDAEGGDGAFSGQAQFEMEAEVLGKYRHPNIVALLGTGTVRLTDGGALNPCLVYEFMPGQSLNVRLRPEPGQTTAPYLTAPERLVVASDIARGLSFLHSICRPPIIHQDIKSDNILLGPAGINGTTVVAKIADFGTARMAPALGVGTGRQQGAQRSAALMASATHHSTCHVVGTGPYMPPEYMQMGHVSPKTDTYAYGVVLLELLSGLPAADPVTRQTLANTMGAVVEDPKRLLKGALDARAGKWDSKASRALPSAGVLVTAAGPVTGDSIECRTYHAHAAAAEGAVHCPHAAFESTEFCISPQCVAYCDAFEASCTGLAPGYASRTACLSACSRFPATGAAVTTAGPVTGDSVECRTYHARAAASEGAVHCGHAFAQSTEFCRGAAEAAQAPAAPAAEGAGAGAGAAAAAERDGYVSLGTGAGAAPLQLKWSVAADNSSVAYEIRVARLGWLAFGLCGPDNTMIGSEVALARPASVGAETVLEHVITGRSRGLVLPVPAAQRRIVLGSLTQGGGATTLRYTKLLRPAPPNSGMMPPEVIDAAPSTFCYAYGTSNIFGYHGPAFRGVASIRITSTYDARAARVEEVDASSGEETLLEAHATLMVIAYAILLPSGACAAHFCRVMRQETWWYKLHRSLQCLGLMVALAGFGCIIAVFERRDSGHFYLPHHKLGLSVMVLSALQPLNAVLRPPKDVPRVLWTVLHKGCGYTILALGITNCALGLDLDTTQGFPELRGQTRTFFFLGVGSVALSAVIMLVLSHAVDQDEVQAAIVLGYDNPMLARTLTGLAGAGVGGRNSLSARLDSRHDGVLGYLLFKCPKFLDLVQDYVRSKAYAVGLLIFIFFQAIAMVESVATASISTLPQNATGSTGSSLGTRSRAYGYAEHIVVLTTCSLPLFLGNSRHHTQMWAITSFVVIPASIGGSVVVSSYIGFEFGSWSLAQFAALGLAVCVASAYLLLRYSGVTVLDRGAKEEGERRRKYVTRLLRGVRRMAKGSGSGSGTKRGAPKRTAKPTVSLLSTTGRMQHACTLALQHARDAFVVDAAACRPYPLRFLIAQSLSLLIVLKLGSFMLQPTGGRALFDSVVASILLRPRDSLLLAASMNRELTAQTQPLADMCQPASLASQSAFSSQGSSSQFTGSFLQAQGGIKAICEWRFGGVTGAVIKDGVLSTEPAVSFEVAAATFDSLATSLTSVYPVAMCAAVVCGVANIVLSFPRYQRTLLALRSGKIPLWDAEIENNGPVAAPACDFVGVQFSTAVASLVSSFMLFEFVGICFDWEPFRSLLSSVFVRLLPVLVTAVVIYFIKRAWINPVLARRGSVVEREAFIAWDFFMLFYGVVEGVLKSFVRFVMSLGISTVFLARTDVALFPGDLWEYDVGYYSYLAVVRQAEMHTNPVLHEAVAVLLRLCAPSSKNPAAQRPAPSARGGKIGGVGGGTGAAAAAVQQAAAARARSRWLLAVTLINNPALRSCRKSVVVEAARSQRVLISGLAKDASAHQDSWVRARIKHTLAQRRQRAATSAMPEAHASALGAGDTTAQLAQQLDRTADSHSNAKPGTQTEWGEEVLL
eukprot:g1169.t1